MANISRHDAWQAGDSYEQYMGRWSRQVAPHFLKWLAPSADVDWLEVGCGTGALSSSILAQYKPKSLLSIDPSPGFIQTARANVMDPRVTFSIADAQDVPVADGTKDVIVSGLVLNFVPDRPKALSEMKRVARSGARLGFYVWDYPGSGVQFMRAFWTAAARLNSGATDLSEVQRFPFCTPDGLRALVDAADFTLVEITALEVPTIFQDFDDYWRPFTLGAGPRARLFHQPSTRGQGTAKSKAIRFTASPRGRLNSSESKGLGGQGEKLVDCRNVSQNILHTSRHRCSPFSNQSSYRTKSQLAMFSSSAADRCGRPLAPV